MAIPEFQAFMKPYLTILKDGKEKHFREMVEELAQYFNITEMERKEPLQSGQSRFENRVGWAKTYLYHAGLIESPRRGFNKISKSGLKVLKENPKKITTKSLLDFPEFVAFQGKRKIKDEKKVVEPENNIITPEEILDKAYSEVMQKLVADILEQVSKLSPKQFEKLVVELLVKMGYGGSMHDAGQAIGKSGDEGIDGIIKEDKLGLDKIYIQAKKWDVGTTIGRPEIHKFTGALAGKGASKGVFITTAKFSKEARDYNPANVTIVLIDGFDLAHYMIDHNLGVTVTSTYEIKRLDSDYFDMV